MLSVEGRPGANSRVGTESRAEVESRAGAESRAEQRLRESKYSLIELRAHDKLQINPFS